MTGIDHLLKLYARKRYTKLIREGLEFIIANQQAIPAGWGFRADQRNPVPRMVLFQATSYDYRNRTNSPIELTININRLVTFTHDGRTQTCYLNECKFENLSSTWIWGIAERVGDLLFLLLPKERITITRILSCHNAAVQSNLIRTFGDKEFFNKLNATIIHQDGENQLLRVRVGRGIDIMMVKVIDSTTGHPHLLRVPPSVPVNAADGRPLRRIRAGIHPGHFNQPPLMAPMRTCKQAIAWTFNMKESEYHPEKET